MGSQFALARYDVYGNLDTSFHHDGKVLTRFGELDARGRALAIDELGRIIVAGEADEYFALVRYNDDGSLDTGFGGDGKVVTSLGPTSAAEGRAVAIDSRGRIVVGGSVVVGENQAVFALARYLDDGHLDMDFGQEGRVRTDFSSTGGELMYSLAVDRHGRIVAGGTAGGAERSHFALARYNDDGSLDTSFGGDGKVLTDFGPGSRAQGMALAIDRLGRIVLGGSDSYRFALARYREDGSLDTSFNGSGRVTTDFSSTELESSSALLIDRFGRIVVAGVADQMFVLARYNEDGSLDTSFHDDGMVLTDFRWMHREGALAMALDGQDRILVGGYAYRGTPDQLNSCFAVARYTDVGTLDPSFHFNGMVITDFLSTTTEMITALAYVGGRGIVVAGFAWSPD